MARTIPVCGRNRNSEELRDGRVPTKGMKKAKIKIKRRLNEWSEANMESAIKEYNEQKPDVKIRNIARAWGVPNTTLQRRVAGRVKGYEHTVGKKPCLSAESEAKLTRMITLLSSRGFPLGMREVRDLAYQYSEKIS